MESIPSFNALIEKSIIDHWDRDALTDFKGATLQYHDVARKIEKLHIMFENCGVEKGDKIALCGRNSANWAAAFLAVLTYGAVAVPILHEFMPDQVHNIVNHSDSKLLFVGDVVATTIDATKMPGLEGIINIPEGKSLPNILSKKIRTCVIVGEDKKLSQTVRDRFRSVRDIFLPDMEAYTCESDGTLIKSNKLS